MTELQPLTHSSPIGSDGWSSSPVNTSGNTNMRDDAFTGSISPRGGATQAQTDGTANGPPGSLGAAASFFASPFASVGMEYGKTLIKNNTVLNSGLGGWLRGSRFRYYFQINQSYIGKKIGKVLFPFIHSGWVRQPLDEVDEGLVAASGGASPTATWKPPSQDINAPDLYIGVMSFLTFVVTMGMALGIADQFNPEMLGITASRSLICLFLEVAFIFIGFYLSDVPLSPAVLDLIALAGYKYVALNVDILIGLLFGPTVFWIAFFVFSISTVVFMVRTLNGWVPSSATPKFRGLLAMFGGIQFLVSLFLLWPALTSVHQTGVVTRWSNHWTRQPAIVGDEPISTNPHTVSQSTVTEPTPVAPVDQPTPITPIVEAQPSAASPLSESPINEAPVAAPPKPSKPTGATVKPIPASGSPKPTSAPVAPSNDLPRTEGEVLKASEQQSQPAPSQPLKKPKKPVTIGKKKPPKIN